ncbi:MAG: hypothetical protein ACLU7D_04515 [Collinsella sp.]
MVCASFGGPYTYRFMLMMRWSHHAAHWSADGMRRSCGDRARWVSFFRRLMSARREPILACIRRGTQLIEVGLAALSSCARAACRAPTTAVMVEHVEARVMSSDDSARPIYKVRRLSRLDR